MTPVQFMQRERRRLWQERTEIFLGLLLMAVSIGAVLILCLAIDSAVRGIRP